MKKVLMKVNTAVRLLFMSILLMLAVPDQVFSQSSQISGKVVDEESGEALLGVSILEEGTSNGTITDINGEFVLNLTNASATLVVSYVGYESQTIKASGSTLTIRLREDITLLGQVVVVGYAEQERTEVTGAIAKLESKDFNRGIIESPEQLLQSKIAGVRITSSSGEPGAPITLTIRGAGALRSGDSPLYVIDNVPISNASTSPAGGNLAGSALPTTSGVSNPLSFLNADDIETITVLKDASATAIYGSRGANGVGLITTKQGQAGKPTLSFNSSIGISNVANKLDVLTSSDIGDNSGVDTDWQDEIFQTGITENYNLAFSAGSTNSSIRASASILEQEGVIRGSSLDRYTARVNSSTLVLNDKLKLNLNLIGSQTRNFRVPRADAADTQGELITNTLGALPNRTVRDASGAFSSGPTNPVGLLESFTDRTITNRFLTNFSASYEIIEGLNYQANFGADISDGRREQELRPNNLEGVAADGTYAVGDVSSTNILFEHYLSYSKNWSNNKIDALLGYANQRFSRESEQLSYVGFTLPNISAIDNPANVPTQVGLPLGSNTTTRLESVFARVNYSYNEQLNVSASIRADGSSKFADGNQWGYFPAVAASYNFINDPSSSAISRLQGRIGWGQTRNQNVPGNPTVDEFDFVQISNTEVGLRKVSEGNPDLEWEISNQFNIGVNYGFFGDRLTGSLDYFSKTNERMILFVASEPPAVSGQWINLPGDISNSGIELGINYQAVKSADFNLVFDANATFISNEVNLRDGEELITGAISGPSLGGTFVQVVRTGEALGSFLLPTLQSDGSLGENTIQGTGIPDFTYGFNIYAEYKNFDFSTNLAGVAGNKIYNNTAHFLNNAGNNVTQEIADETRTIPSSPSDFFLEDGGFLRLNNLTLGYSPNIQSNNYIKSVRFYVTGQNLFVITDYSGYDPEVNTPRAQNGILSYGIDFGTYPRARTFIFGVNVKF